MSNTEAKDIARAIAEIWAATPQDSDARIGIVNVANELALMIDESTRGWVSADEFLDICWGNETVAA